MSTRSGKRIHSSPPGENNNDIEASRKGIKTRSKRMKNKDFSDEHLTEKKRKKHYVRYPSDEKIDNSESNGKSDQTLRKSRRNTLKERNADDVTAEETEIMHTRTLKTTRNTRRCEEPDDNITLHIAEDAGEKKKKNNKKKKTPIINENKMHMDSDEVVAPSKKKTNKKRNKKKSSSITVEEVVEYPKVLNASGTSVDSFHSAAGSPKYDENCEESYMREKKSTPEQTKYPTEINLSPSVNNSSNKKGHINNVSCNQLNGHASCDEQLETRNLRKRKSSTSSSNHVEDEGSVGHTTKQTKSIGKKKRKLSNLSFESGTTFVKEDIIMNCTFKKDNKTSGTFNKNITFDAVDESNTTFDKEDKLKRNKTNNKIDATEGGDDKANNTLVMKNNTNTALNKKDQSNITFGKNGETNRFKMNCKDKFDEKDKTNTTFDMENKDNSTFNNEDRANSTFDKKDKSNTTFDKEDKTNSTFDTEHRANSTFNKEDTAKTTFDKKDKTNTTFDKEDRANSTFDKKDKTNTTFDKEHRANSTFDKKDKTNTTFDKEDRANSTFDKNDKTNTTFDKEDMANSTFDKKDKTNTTFDKEDRAYTTFDKKDKTNTTFDKEDRANSTFDKKDKTNTTFDKNDRANNSFNKKTRANSKFDKKDKTNTTFNKEDKVNTTFYNDNRTFDENHEANTTLIDKKDKLNGTFDKSGNTESAKKGDMNNIANENSVNKKRNSIRIDKRESEANISLGNISNDNSNESLLTSDTSKSSHISVTTDESQCENILNNTPVLVESSMEEENISKTTSPTPRNVDTTPPTPLKREGTFTKNSPEPKVIANNRKSVDKTPIRRKSLPSPGRTPFPLAKSLSKDKSILNVTRSIDKSRRSSIAETVPRATKVMFCSPSNNPTVVSAMKGKIIKSSLKGSNKSFIFDDNSCSSPPRVAGRKRSQTADRAAGLEPHAKRSRLVEPPAATAPSPRPPRTPRLRTRTLSASAKLPEVISEVRRDSPAKERVRTRLPNFAALHARQFARMESLDECQRRRAERARLLLTPTGPVAVDRLSPNANDNQAPKQSEPNPPRKTETPTKSKPQAAAAGYSRFGFKLQADAAGNPFSFTASKTAAAARPAGAGAGLKRQATMPSLAGTTRKQLARQAVMREKSFAGKRDNRQESRTVIKGVRTNRRFELQMRMRNINT